MRFATGIGLAFLLVPGFALAGSQGDPEITDDSDDVPAAAVNILNVWLQTLAPDSFEVSMEIQELPPAPGIAPCVPTDLGCLGAGVELFYRVDFRAHGPDGVETLETSDDFLGSYVAATFADGADAADSFWAFGLGHHAVGAAGSVLIDDFAIEGRIEGSVITWVVPRWAPGIEVPNGTGAGGYSLRGLAAETSITPRVVAGILIPADEAGPGADFYFPLPPAGPTWIPLDGPRLAQEFTESVSGEHVYNLSVDASEATVAYTLAADSGAANISLRDAGGNLLFEADSASEASGETAIKGAAPGDWVLTVDYANFTGAIDVEIIPASEPEPDPQPEPEPETQPDPAPEAPAAGETTNSPVHQGPLDDPVDTSDQEAPGVGLLLVVLALAGAVIRRR